MRLGDSQRRELSGPEGEGSGAATSITVPVPSEAGAQCRRLTPRQHDEQQVSAVHHGNTQLLRRNRVCNGAVRLVV